MSQFISYRNILKLAFPVSLSQSTIVLSGLIDLAFVSRYGTRAIAAVSIANAIVATLYNFLEGLRTGTTVLVARAVELKEEEQATGILNIGLVAALAIGLLIAGMAKFIGDVAYCSFDDPVIRFYGSNYLRIWLLAVPVTLVLNVLFGFLRGFSDTVTPLKVSVTICVLNALFDYLLVYGKFGLPGMGPQGSALATLLSTIAGLIVMAVLLLNNGLFAKYFYFNKAAGDVARRYWKLVLEIDAYTGFMNLAIAVFVMMMGWFGSVELAVHQITFQIFLISYLFTMGYLVSASIVVPKLMAQEQTELMIQNVTRIGKASFLSICLFSLVCFLFAPEIAAFFSPGNLTVIITATKTIRLVCIAQLFSAVYMTLRGALTGCGDTKFIAWEGFISGYLIFLPLAFVLAVVCHYKVYGGYLAFLGWCITDCIAFGVRFYFQGGWRKRVLK